MIRIISAILLAALSGAAAAQARRVETGFLDRAVTVGSETYSYQVYVPATYTPDRQWPVILFLHGGDERGTDGLLPTEVGIGTAIRKDRARFPAVVVFPQVVPGHLWDNAMQSQAVAALEHTINEFRGDRDRVYLTGLSIGGRGAWALAYRDPNRFAALVVITGPVMVLDRPSYTTEMRDTLMRETDFVHATDSYGALASRVKNIPIWLFHGSADPVHPVSESRQLADALRKVNGVVRYNEYEGVGHNSWDRAYAEPELMAWLLAQHRESRRQ
jgi:predicted peptidase